MNYICCNILSLDAAADACLVARVSGAHHAKKRHNHQQSGEQSSSMRGHQSRSATQRVRCRARQRIRCNYRRLGGSWPAWRCQTPIFSPGSRVIKPTKGEAAGGEPVGALRWAWKNPAKCNVKTVPSTSSSASACGLNELSYPSSSPGTGHLPVSTVVLSPSLAGSGMIR